MPEGPADNYNNYSTVPQIMFLSQQLKGRESEWSNPQIKEGKLPEMPKNQVKRTIHSVQTKL